MTKVEKIQSAVDTYNYEYRSVDPNKIVRELADEVIEEQSEYIHYLVDDEEWEIIYRQDHHGNWTATNQKYEVDE